MFFKWTNCPRPGIWAAHNLHTAAEATAAIRQSIPKDEGYIDGVVLNFEAPVELPAINRAIDKGIQDSRPLEASLDILVIVREQLVQALRYPAAQEAAKTKQ